MAVQRILRATAATLTWQPTDSTGEPADPGTVTVGVVSSDGTVVKAVLTATSGTGSSPRTVALTAAQTANLDRLTATWTVSGTVVASTYHEVVGGFYFSATELRASEPSLANTSTDPTAKILMARAEVEEKFEAHGRPGFVPRFTVERLSTSGGVRHMLSRWPLRRVRWVRQWYGYQSTPTYLDYTATEVAGIYVDSVTDAAVFPSIVAGYESVQVGYEYGFDDIPADVKAAAMTYGRLMVNRHRSAVPDRAVSMTSPEGTSYQLGRVGTVWRPTGIDDIDEILTRPEFQRVSIG